MRIHLDTDLGDNPDDLCALVMLLGWPGVELVGVTTVGAEATQRAGYVRAVLAMAGRDDVPVAAGESESTSTGSPMGRLANHERYWDDVVQAPSPSPPSPPARELLVASTRAGATVVAVGPATNLARLEDSSPGALAGVPVVMMGGWLAPPREGLPAWGPDRDRNVRWDPVAARAVFESTRLTLVPLATTLQVPLRRSDLPRLHGAGPLGRLLARQLATYAEELALSASDRSSLGRSSRGLPDDLLALPHDAVACAAALGWSGITAEDVALRPVVDGDLLRFTPDAAGRPTRVATAVDADALRASWFRAVEAAGASPGRPPPQDAWA